MVLYAQTLPELSTPYGTIYVKIVDGLGREKTRFTAGEQVCARFESTRSMSIIAKISDITTGSILLPSTSVFDPYGGKTICFLTVTTQTPLGPHTLKISIYTSRGTFLGDIPLQITIVSQAQEQTGDLSDILFMIAIALAVIMVIFGFIYMRRKSHEETEISPIIPQIPAEEAVTPPTPQEVETAETRKLGEGVLPAPSPLMESTRVYLASLTSPEGKALYITQPEQEFGRKDFREIVSQDKLPMISRRHFMLRLQGNKWYIMDLGSTNGTYVNGEDIRGKGWVPLEDGDVISVAGVAELTFKIP